MNISTDTFWENATFMPDDDPTRIDQLLEEIYKKREVALIAFCLKTIAVETSLCNETGFTNNFIAVKNAKSIKRKRLVKHPVFNAWFKQIVRITDDKNELQEKLREFEFVLKKVLVDEKNEDDLLIDGKRISVKRFDVDELIMNGAFPEYELPTKERQNNFTQNVLYSESFFREMLEVALGRINSSWHEAYINFPRFVNIIVDMIDGEYTSYSSAEHIGVIFVSTDNSPLVALEEFLMHEFGHQILYHVMEIDPLIGDSNKIIYKLPWSGNERDFYGYFHAFYIYILIACYLEKVLHRSKREQSRIEKRRKHIISGLIQTVNTFEKTGNFTEKGKIFFNNLKLKVEKIRSNNVNSNQKVEMFNY